MTTQRQLRHAVTVAGVAVLEERTLDVLDEQKIELDGDLDCSADIADDGAVTGACAGTPDADDPVASSLGGVVDVDDTECTSSVRVDVAGETIADDPEFDCLD